MANKELSGNKILQKISQDIDYFVALHSDHDDEIRFYFSDYDLILRSEPILQLDLYKYSGSLRVFVASLHPFAVYGDVIELRDLIFKMLQYIKQRKLKDKIVDMTDREKYNTFIKMCEEGV